MLHLEEIPAVKACKLITANLETAKKLKLQLKWGYTIDGTIFGRILGRQGQILHEQFYLGEDMWVQINEVHSDFAMMLDSFAKARRLSIQRKWNERGRVTADKPVMYRERAVISLVERKKHAFSLARLLTVCFG